jgi:hypothetical protein
VVDDGSTDNTAGMIARSGRRGFGTGPTSVAREPGSCRGPQPRYPGGNRLAGGLSRFRRLVAARQTGPAGSGHGCRAPIFDLPYPGDLVPPWTTGQSKEKTRPAPWRYFQRQSAHVCCRHVHGHVQRRVFDRYGLFDESLPCCEDYDLWLRVGCREPFLLVSEALTAKTAAARISFPRCTVWVWMSIAFVRLLRLLASGALNPGQHQLARAELERKCTIYGQGCCKHGRPEEGAYYLALAARDQPQPEQSP